MHKKQLKVIYSFIFLLVAAFAVSLTRVTPKVASDYEDLMAAVPSSNKEGYATRQEREGVNKAILFTEGNDRLQILLKGVSSELRLDTIHEKTEVVEEMKGVKGLMQEDLYYLLADGREVIRSLDGRFMLKGANPKDVKSFIEVPLSTLKPMQTIRYLEADSATYYYKTDRFIASDVSVARLTFPSHKMPETLDRGKVLMKGIAKRVEFTLASNDINFKAEEMRGTLYRP